jgi:invasion protein IalB
VKTTSRLRLPVLVAAAGLVIAPLVAPALAQQQQPVQQFGPRAQPPQGQPQQGQRPQRQGPPPAVVLGKFGDWQLQCETQQPSQLQGQSALGDSSGDGSSGKSDPAAKKAGEQNCGLVQNTRDPKRENIQMSLIIASGMQNNKRVTMMRVIAPIGVFLPTGVALEIDGEAVGRVPFTRCLPQVCVAFAEASPPTLEKLKKGGKANFIIYEAPGLGITMPISLSGFTKGLEELEKL